MPSKTEQLLWRPPLLPSAWVDAYLSLNYDRKKCFCDKALAIWYGVVDDVLAERRTRYVGIGLTMSHREVSSHVLSLICG